MMTTITSVTPRSRKIVLFSRQKLTLFTLLLLCTLLAIYGLGSGTLSLSPMQVIDALRGEGPHNLTVIVTQWRLPRVAMALILGAALAASGAIFQSLMRNPLGSPDVIGFNTGAYSGVLVAIVLFNSTILGITFGAMAGGLLTAAVVYLLAWRNGIETFRLIIVGIAVRALLVAGNTWLVISASLESALTAGLWSAGSLNGITWAKSLPVVGLIIVAWGLAVLLSRRMHLLEMGDDMARALGVPVERSRLVLLVADVATQRLFLPYQLPVGVLTVSLGGIYLMGLLIRESRRK